ncbi:MAG: hypothetical protein HKN73_08200 [Gemmatimonadetes bacterium]|nr:hypothetical protein [Gemmatimonadota bacterium]
MSRSHRRSTRRSTRAECPLRLGEAHCVGRLPRGSEPRWSAIAVVLGFVSVLTVPTGAGGQESLDGVWAVDWPQAVRYESDGSMEIQAWGEAVLTLEQVGDRVAGTWATDIIEPVEWYVEGSYTDGQLRLEARTHNSSNPEFDIVDHMIWDATMVGAELEGRVAIVIRGREGIRRWRPWTGRRLLPGDPRDAGGPE